MPKILFPGRKKEKVSRARPSHVGLKGRCKKCGCKFILTEEDPKPGMVQEKVFMWGMFFAYAVTVWRYKVSCPNCEEKVLVTPRERYIDPADVP